MVDLSITLAGLNLATPLMLASGTVGYGPEYDGLIDFAQVGAIITKTVTCPSAASAGSLTPSK